MSLKSILIAITGLAIVATPAIADPVPNPITASGNVPPPGTTTADGTPPRWIRGPDGGAIAEAYPPEALRNGVRGRVVLHCRVHMRGVLRDCTVVSATPEGQGFSEAGLRLAGYFTLTPLYRDGHPVDDVWLYLPISLVP